MKKELLYLALEIMDYAKSKGFKLNQNLVEHLRVRLQMSSYRDYEKDNELYSGIYSVPMSMKLIAPLVDCDNETPASFDYLNEDDNDYSCFSATIEFKKVLSNIFINIPIFAFADTPFKILVAMKSNDVTLTIMSAQDSTLYGGSSSGHIKYNKNDLNCKYVKKIKNNFYKYNVWQENN